MDSKFTWTQEYRRTWEEDHIEDKPTVFEPRHTHLSGHKNLIRHLFVALDISSSIEKSEFIPTVRHHVSMSLSSFVDRFKKLNPLSIMSFASFQDTLLTFTKTFDPRALLGTVGNGSFSLFNTLSSAISILKKSRFSREILIITASIGTRDNSSYESIVSQLKKYNIKINIISICGEVTLFRRIVSITNGRLVVPMNLGHFEMLLDEFALPLRMSETTAALVRLGFPDQYRGPGMCMCHLTSSTSPLFECPNCRALVCSLPAQCYICETQLVSPMDLVRTGHFLFPAVNLKEATTKTCKVYSKEAHKACPSCDSSFCHECAEFILKELLFCPFCSQDGS